jgi:hypothetical protein
VLIGDEPYGGSGAMDHPVKPPSPTGLKTASGDLTAAANSGRNQPYGNGASASPSPGAEAAGSSGRIVQMPAENGTAAETAVAGAKDLSDLTLSKRHLLGNLSIPKATGNSLFLGSREAAMADLAEIQSGTAVRTGEFFETSSNRVWGTHNDSVHPVSGPDIVNVSSQEYKILVQAQKQGVEKAMLTLDKMAEKNLLTPEQVARTQKIITKIRSKKGG